MSILRKIGSVLALAMLAHAAAAQGITIPNTFVNGVVADAPQVNANFTALANSALNRTGGTMTGTLTTLLVQPTVTNTSDVGTSGLLYRTGYYRTSLVLGQAAGNYTLTWANPAAARAISIADPGGTDVFTFNAATQSLTNKTITQFAPLTVNGTSGSHVFNGGANQAQLVTISNTTSGTAAESVLRLVAGSLTGNFEAFSQGFTTTGSAFAASLRLYADGAAGLVYQADNATGLHRWYTSTTERMRLHASGGLSLGNTTDPGAGGLTTTGGGNGTYAATLTNANATNGLGLKVDTTASAGTGKVFLVSTGANVGYAIDNAANVYYGANITDAVGAPTVSACGTSPGTPVGKDYAFSVVVGSSGAFNTCTINFNVTYANAPICTVSQTETDSVTVSATTTTTLTLFTRVGNFTVSNKLWVQCRGY